MKCSFIAGAIIVAAGAVPARAQQSVPFADQPTVRVMTRNVDHGVIRQIRDVATANTPGELLAKVADVYSAYFAKNFPERAAAIAAEIDKTRPELIGLQEAILVRTQFPADGPATPATTIALDYVQILLDALEARGLHYGIAVQQDGFDVEMPSALGFDVRHTDREVILARSDLRTADLQVWNAQGGNFASNCFIPSALLGNVIIKRSWVSIDAKIRGASFRLVSTHLDGDCLPYVGFQRAQAGQLLGGPAVTGLPTLMIGDFNSQSGLAGAASDFLSAGFSDPWFVALSGQGLTCCQSDDLLNPVPLLDRRIDFVLYRGAFTPLAADTVGDDAADRTPSGLWPSDHAGVVVSLQIPLPRGW